MENSSVLSSRLIALAGGLLLITAITWLNWPQALPKTNLTLAQYPDNLVNNVPEEPKQPVMPEDAVGNQGDLAFVWQDQLYVAEAVNGSVRALSDSGRAIAPAWSHDGEWLAYIRITDTETNRGPLWLVRRDGSEAHEVQGLPGPLWYVSFEWSPTANQLAVAVHGNGLWLVPTTGKPEQLDPAPWLYRPAWSPDGRYIAYNFCLSGDTPKSDGDHDILCVMDIKQRQRHDLVQTNDAGVRVLGWWPDGNGILYWEVPAHGGSVATDGIMIQSVSLAYTQIKGQPIVTAANADPVGTVLKRADAKSPQPVELVTTLPKLHWTKFTHEGKLLAVMGFGRIAWAEKQLVLVEPKTGKVEQLPPPA
ncbi:MAG TPA: biopolymer transporter Tol, partial [Firmicutes bacterium]|nr:biopolymer transporter Tol [Bacillota bacterium]